MIPIGFAYGELTSSLNISGGEFAYTFKALGRLPAFICGWFMCMGYLIILPWVAISVAVLTSHVFPFLNSIPLYTIMDYKIYLPHVLLSCLMIIIIFYLNWKGIKQSTTFQNIATVVMLITFVIFLIGGVSIGAAENLKPLFSPDGAMNGVVLAMASILFFMTGFDAIPKAVEEA